MVQIQDGCQNDGRLIDKFSIMKLSIAYNFVINAQVDLIMLIAVAHPGLWVIRVWGLGGVIGEGECWGLGAHI